MYHFLSRSPSHHRFERYKAYDACNESVPTVILMMNEFIANQDPARQWDIISQDDLVKKYQECIQQRAWDELEFLAVASRQSMHMFTFARRV